MTNPYRAMCAELLQELCCHYRSWELKEGHCSDAMNRARTLLDQPEPEGMTDEEIDCVFLEESHLDDYGNHFMELKQFRVAVLAVLARWGRPTPQSLPSGYIDPEHKGEDLALLQAFYQACRAEGGTADEIHLRGIRAVLAANPTPQPPVDGEVAELVEWLGNPIIVRLSLAASDSASRWLTRAAELLQRQHPQPVPVSERLPGADDVNEDGNCWLWNRESYFWDWTYVRTRTRAEMYSYTHWLPANALPLPPPQQ